MNFLEGWTEHVITERVPRAEFGHLYVLLRAGVVVYVGQTTNIEQRLGWHRFGSGSGCDDVKDFDRALSLKLPVADLRPAEAALIRRFNPIYCWKSSKDESRDEEMLSRFGLTPDQNQSFHLSSNLVRPSSLSNTMSTPVLEALMVQRFA